MKRKTFNLISGITAGVSFIAEALVVYLNPPCSAPIIASIPVVEGAIVTACGNFVKD